MAQIVFVGLVGLALFLVGLRQVRKSRDARDWPRSAGTIISAAIRSTQSADPESASLYLALEYRFQVAGQNFMGQKICPVEQLYTSTKQAQAALATYPAGSQVEVFYDPQNPSNCILKRGNPYGWALLIIGIAAILLSVAAMLK